MIKIQYGCGLSAVAGWRNFDGSPTLFIQRLPVIGKYLTHGRVTFPTIVEFGDITKQMPFQDGEVDYVYCSHVLEHLSLSDLRRALAETRRILKPGGVFRGVLPDLRILAQRYVAEDNSTASNEFMRATMLGMESRKRGLAGILESTLGNSGHLWMWDYKGLAVELRNAGFSDVHEAKFSDSKHTVFGEIEEADRWIEGLGFEAV